MDSVCFIWFCFGFHFCVHSHAIIFDYIISFLVFCSFRFILLYLQEPQLSCPVCQIIILAYIWKVVRTDKWTIPFLMLHEIHKSNFLSLVIMELYVHSPGQCVWLYLLSITVTRLIETSGWYFLFIIAAFVYCFCCFCVCIIYLHGFVVRSLAELATTVHSLQQSFSHFINIVILFHVIMNQMNMKQENCLHFTLNTFPPILDGIWCQY